MNAGSPQDIFHDPAYLNDLRRQMVKFATLQLSDAAWAEDAVQDALTGALKNAHAFAGRAAFKTWVFGILKNKIADTLRARLRIPQAESLEHADDEASDLEELFDERGHWLSDEKPDKWGQPETALREKHFWRIFDACLENLPTRQARIFMMREFVEMESTEICASTGLTVSNLNVMLYRARLRLRECLENRWFVAGEAIQ